VSSSPAIGASSGNHYRDRATPLLPGRQYAHRRPATGHHPLVPWVIDQPVIPSGTAAEVKRQASDTALRYDALPWCRPARWRVLPSFGLTSVIWLVCVQGMSRPGSNTTLQLMARLSVAQ